MVPLFTSKYNLKSTLLFTYNTSYLLPCPLSCLDIACLLVLFIYLEFPECCVPFDKLCLLCNVPTAWSTLHSQSAGRISNYPSGLSINVTFLWNLSLYPWQEYDFLPLYSYSNLYIYLPWNLSKHIIVACLCTLSLFDSPAVLWGSAMHGLYIVQLFLPGDKQRASDRVSSKLMLEIFFECMSTCLISCPKYIPM